MIKRINLLSGPCAGKSTIAAYVYAQLKSDGHHIELIQEYVKEWAYEGRKITSMDQVYLFAKQLRREDLVLRSDKIECIVTDSPLALIIYYSMHYEFNSWKNIQAIADEFELQHPSLNIFLERDNIPYSNIGRYETYDEALKVDRGLLNYLDTHIIPYHRINSRNWDGIMNLIATHLWSQ